MRFSVLIAFFLLIFSLVVAIGIESVNGTEKGGVLQNWHRNQNEEYREGGSGVGKMRGRSDFQNALTLFGVPVYGLSPLAALLFANQALKTSLRSEKIGFTIGALLCLGILGRFFFLGVFSAGPGLG